MSSYCEEIALILPTHSHLTPVFHVIHFEFLDESYTAKTTVLGLFVGDTIVACDRRRMDGQTDRHSDDS